MAEARVEPTRDHSQEVEILNLEKAEDQKIIQSLKHKLQVCLAKALKIFADSCPVLAP